MPRSDSLATTIRGHRKALMYAGTALALASAGTASAATVATSSAGSPTAPITARPHTAAHAGAASPARSSDRHGSSPRPSTGHQSDTAHGSDAGRSTAHTSTAHSSDAGRSNTRRSNVDPGRAHLAVLAASAEHPAAQHRAAIRLPAQHLARHPAHAAAKVETWGGVSGALNRETNPAAARRGELPPADKLLPTGVSGPQSWMPVSPPQYANATTIVQQALSRRMGLRSAVVAVATAMQESQLLNLSYGTSDSLGLFQQRPSMGWGTPGQVTDPAYAAGKFLSALHLHQAADPTWASQPLWASAQAVQNSGFPYAYAKWEAQAAHLVQSIAMRLQ